MPMPMWVALVSLCMWRAIELGRAPASGQSVKDACTLQHECAPYSYLVRKVGIFKDSFGLFDISAFPLHGPQNIKNTTKKVNGREGKRTGREGPVAYMLYVSRAMW